MSMLPAAGCLLFSIAAATAQELLPPDVLRGTVTDGKGAPVAGVTVEVLRRDAYGFTCLDLRHARSTRKVQTLRTGRNGTFAGQLPRGVPFELHVDDGSNAPIWTSAVYAGEDIALQLLAPARLSISLHDEAGKPWPGGTLELWDGNYVRWVDGSIDDQGRWQSDRLPPGPMTVEIAPDSARRPDWQKLTLEAGVATPLDLMLDPGCALSGRITDKQTGRPIANACIGEGWTMDKHVTTGADGRYEMRGYGAPGYGAVRVTATGYGPQFRRVAAKAEGAAADFQLETATEATGRIVNAAGKPVARAYVAAVGGTFAMSDDQTHDWCSAETDAEGRYRLQDLRANVAHVLMIRAEGFATIVGEMPDLGPTPLQLNDVVMRPCRYVSGVVVDSAGKPLPGIPLSLHGTNSDRARLLAEKSKANISDADYYIAERKAKTDSLGRIHFADVPPGTYELTVGDRRSQQPSISITVVAGKDPEPFRIER
jgi:protocatechuate 3,4-dioxygenase beta subunit